MNVFRFSLATVFLTFTLLAIGGIVNPTGSSLACPDWPTCYGSFFPEMKDGVLYEHGHRIAGTVVGFFTLVQAFLVVRNRAYSKTLRRLSVLALLLVILQGVLGGVTVVYKLPLFVSTGHLAISMLFFSLMIYLSFRLYHERFAGLGQTKAATEEKVDRPWMVLAAGISVYLQIVLGAFVRHTHSGRSCGTDIPFCQGIAWPDVWPQKLHMLHRYMGVAVGLFVIVVSLSVLKQAKRRGLQLAYFNARFAPTLVVIQILLGVVTVTSFVGLVEVGMHMIVGAALLANMWSLFLALSPKQDFAPAQDVFDLSHLSRQGASSETNAVAKEST